MGRSSNEAEHEGTRRGNKDGEVKGMVSFHPLPTGIPLLGDLASMIIMNGMMQCPRRASLRHEGHNGIGTKG